jgi:cytochrome c biogenesis protein
LSTESLDLNPEKGADGPNGGAASAPRRGLIAALTSSRLVLWLVGILALAMVVATLVPQNAPEEAYLRVFGTLLGPLIAKTTLRHIYSSWWFIGAFVLLAVSLVTCVLQRAARLLRQERAWPGPVTEQAITGGTHTRWRLPQGVREAADGLALALRNAGYAVAAAPVDGAGKRALVGRRGRLTAWAPIIVHAGLVVILLGAAWGRWPKHTYHATAPLQAGDPDRDTFPVRTADEAFGVRLLDAGTKYDAQGHPTDFWAKVQVLEEGEVVRTTTVRPNAPLRYHHISAVLDTVNQGGYAVAVTKGAAKSLIPVAVGPDGQVDMMASMTLVEDPQWVAFVHAFRDTDEQGARAPAARVFVDRSGQVSHNWQEVGWVGQQPLTLDGVTFQLVPAPGGAGAQLSFDRDIGVPVVFAGFVIISLGALLVLGAPRSRVLALVTESGKGSSALVRVSPAGDQGQAERLWRELERRLGAERQPDRGKLRTADARREKSPSSA